MLHIMIGTRRDVRNQRAKLERKLGARLDCVGMKLKDGAWVLVAKEREKDCHPLQRVAISRGLLGSAEKETGDGVI